MSEFDETAREPDDATKATLAAMAGWERAIAERDALRARVAELEGALGREDETREALKNAFVAGCCAVLTWTNSGMPQDDLDEAGYDYAADAPRGKG